MGYIIDRLEKEAVICEDENGNNVVLSVCEVPEGAKEGDILTRDGDGWKLEQEETLKRRSKMRKKLESLIAKD